MRESLHCVLTAFTMLTGQGEALNIDPLKFYQHLYKALLQLDVGAWACHSVRLFCILLLSKHFLTCNVSSGKSRDDVKLTIECLDAMLAKRKRQVR